MSTRVTRLFAAIFILLLTALRPSSFAQMAGNNDQDLGIAIQPATFDFHVSPGQKVVTTVSVANSQNKPIQIKLDLGDWLRDSTGEHQYFGPSELPVSCASWIKLSQSFVEVPAKGSTSFELTIQAPDSPALFNKMRWAMLFVEFAEERTLPKTDKAGISTVFVKKQRLGLHIYQTPRNVTKKGIEMIDFKTRPGEPKNYLVSYKNTGDIQVQSKAYMELTSLSESGFTKRISTEPVPTFPGQYRIMELKLPADVPKGKYSVIAAVDAGEDVPLEAIQQEIEVK